MSWPPDAEGTHAEPHPRLHGVHAVVELFHQQVHVPATPVVAGERASASPVTLVRGGVGEVDCAAAVRLGIGIEVVVHVHAVDVVAAHDVEDDPRGAAAHGRVARIQPEERAVLADELGM